MLQSEARLAALSDAELINRYFHMVEAGIAVGVEYLNEIEARFGEDITTAALKCVWLYATQPTEQRQLITGLMERIGA